MSWDTGLARTVIFTVQVNGVTRPHESLEWAQDITSDLPQSVTAGGQVGHRTGEIIWARPRPVETQPPSPWHQGAYWIPKTGDRVTIDAADALGNTHRVFTGIIDTIEGDAFGNRSSKIVAAVERHDKVVRYSSLTGLGSPVDTPTGNGEPRRQATTPVWLINEIARELGYHSTPPRPETSKLILDAPLQGSTYNYFQTDPNGEMVVSHRPGYATLPPVWSSGPDGFGVSNALIEWVPRTGAGTGAGNVGISLVAYSPHTEDALVTVTHGTTGYTYLRVLGNGSVRVSTNVGGTTYAHIPAATFTGEGPHRISVTFRANQARTIINGVEQGATNLPTPTGAVTRIKLDAAAGSCVAGLQLWHPTLLADHQNQGWTPTVRFRYGTGTHSTVLTPSVRDEKARDVLDEYASALLSPLWIDGDGVLQVVTGKALHTQPTALTVDALNDVSELSYTMAELDHRPTVEVSYEHAHHTAPTATDAKTVVWQGSGASIDPATPDETFVEVPDDEEWIMLSDPASMKQFLWPSGDTAAFYTRIGSWWGFSYEDSAGNKFMSDDVTQTVETLTPWAWKITSSTTDPNGVQARIPEPEVGTLPQAFKGMNLPILRSRSRVKYEQRTVSQTVGSDPYKGVLTHDTGKWITSTSAASSLCQWIHSMVSSPTPVLENLMLRFDPRVDVGIKVRIRAKEVFGVDFDALILSVDHKPYDDTTQVTARVTQVVSYATTLNDVEYTYVGQSLSRWDQDRAGKTLTAVAANPLNL